jgi:hypothetical protein
MSTFFVLHAFYPHSHALQDSIPAILFLSPVASQAKALAFGPSRAGKPYLQGNYAYKFESDRTTTSHRNRAGRANKSSQPSQFCNFQIVQLLVTEMKQQNRQIVATFTIFAISFRKTECTRNEVFQSSTYAESRMEEVTCTASVRGTKNLFVY